MANNLSVSIAADVTGFKKNIEEAKKLLESYKDAAKKNSTEISKNTSVTKEQVTAYERVVKALDKATNGSQSTAQAQKNLAKQVQELKIQWANLSDEAKKSDFGKSIAESTKRASDQLKVMKTQMEQTKDTTDKSKSSNDSLGTALGSVKAVLGKVAIAVGAAKAAYDAFNVVMKNNETLADSVGSTMTVLRSTVDGFFTSISTGNFKGFLKGLSDIRDKAREAYQALDDLSTFNAFYGSDMSQLDYEINKLRNELMDKNKLTPAQIKDLTTQLEAKLEDRRTLGNQLAEKNRNAYYSKGKNYLSEKGLTGATDADVDAIMGSYDSFNDMLDAMRKEAEDLRANSMKTEREAVFTANGVHYKDTQKWTNKEDEARYNQLQSLINGLSEDAIKEIKQFEQAYWSGLSNVESYEKGVKRQINGATSSGGGSTKPSGPNYAAGSLGDLEQQKQKLEELKKSIDPYSEEWVKILEQIQEVEKEIESIQLFEKAINGELIDMDGVMKEINDLTEDIKIEPIEIDTTDYLSEYITSLNEARDATKALKETTLDTVESGLSLFTSSISSVSSAIEKLSDPDVSGLEKFLTVIELMNSALGTYRSIAAMCAAMEEVNAQAKLKSAAASKVEAAAAAGDATAKAAEAVAGAGSATSSIPIVGPVLAVAAIAAVIAGILAATSQAKSITSVGKFANGGIIGGGSYSGDRQLAMVNSGEMVLNRRQQKNLFNLLDTGGMGIGSGELQTEVKIKGSDLYMILSNYNRKQNKI